MWLRIWYFEYHHNATCEKKRGGDYEEGNETTERGSPMGVQDETEDRWCNAVGNPNGEISISHVFACLLKRDQVTGKSCIYLFENGISMDYCESKDLLRIGELEA